MLYRLHRFVPPATMCTKWPDDEILPMKPPLDTHRTEIRTAGTLRSVCSGIARRMGLLQVPEAEAGSDSSGSSQSLPRILAVDVESHAAESYQGLTCLIQMSTADQDFVIDALRLSPDDCGPLRLLFEDPRVVKVLHGMDRDVAWLQRDLQLMIVNAFDTGRAARILELPSLSLAYLLRVYAEFEADKRF